MEFKIDKDALLKVLRRVSGGVEKKSLPNHALNNVLLIVESGYLKALTTDQEVELSGRALVISEIVPGRVALPFRKLYEICKAFPVGAIINVASDDKRVSIFSENSRFSLAAKSSKDFPSIDATKAAVNFRINAEQFKSLLEKTYFAMAEQDVRYFLNGMLLEFKDKLISAVAADGHRMAIWRLPVDDLIISDLQIIVPRKGVLEILRILGGEGDLQCDLAISDKFLKIAVDGEHVLTTRLLEGRFPDYNSVLPKSGDKILIASKNILKDACLRAAALFSEKLRAIRFCLQSGSLKILASNIDHDQVEEDLSIDYSGADIEIGFNVGYLLDFLNVVTGKTVKLTLSHADHCVLLQEDGEMMWYYVLMPMRI